MAGSRLNVLLQQAGLAPLESSLVSRFEDYLSLFIRWNARINLSAIREEDGILARHFVESIACARALPDNMSTLLDFGSGGGLPGIPIALCRPELEVTLSESRGRKSAFLEEAVRSLRLAAKVYAGRAETLGYAFDCVAMRAVDRMAEAVGMAAQLVASDGWLAVMTTQKDTATMQAAAGAEFRWRDLIPLPGAESRVLALGRKACGSGC